VVIDEAQFIKKRMIDEGYESHRRKNITVLINHLRRKNRKLKVLMLSATSVINNIREGVSLLNMLTGTQYNIPTHNTIRNATRLYTEFQPFSITYLKKTNVKQVGADNPVIVDAELPRHLLESNLDEITWLDIEIAATAYRIPKILEILTNSDGKTVIYTDYVDQKNHTIINMLKNACEGAGYKVGLFIGGEAENKTGLIKKIGTDNEGNDIVTNPFVQGDIDILIASSPFAVGIDEVQYVCNNLIFNGLVWTWAMFEQIIGRVVRTGQAKSQVNIHLVLARINGYDYDVKVKYNRLLQKKAIGDCVRYGTLPEKISFGGTKQERKTMIIEMLKNKQSKFPEREILTLENKVEKLEVQIENVQERAG